MVLAKRAGRPSGCPNGFYLSSLSWHHVVIGHFVVDEEYIHPCRGRLSCDVDSFMTLSSAALVVFLNLAVFDAVMLCRRWIGWVTASTGGWSEQVQENIFREYGLRPDQESGIRKIEIPGRSGFDRAEDRSGEPADPLSLHCSPDHDGSP